MSHRDFDAMLAESGRPSFTLGGQRYECRAKLPWAKWRKLTASVVAEENPDEALFTEKLLRLALLPGDRERFFAALNDDDEDLPDEQVIGMGEVNEIAEWLLEHYTGKTRGNAPTSSPGSEPTGP